MKIALISDTHGFLHPSIAEVFSDCHQIWHAGDIGNGSVEHDLKNMKPFKAVYGNIDGPEIRHVYPEDILFDIEGVRVFMTHIGGYPSKYPKKLKTKLEALRPDLFICGHSHILRVMADKEINLLHINPGAAGNEGFHAIRTVVTFHVEEGKVKDLSVIELGKRGR